MLLYQNEGDLRLKFGKLQFAVHVKITPYDKRVLCCRIVAQQQRWCTMYAIDTGVH